MSDTKSNLMNVVQGEYKIASDPDVVLTTVLGSCVSVCLFDPEKGVGGMNHFLLPGDANSDTSAMRYGANAMELLVNGLLKLGAERYSLKAKVFGGASLLANGRQIGRANAAFARGFLEDEGIECIAESTGGEQARRIRFWPVDGRVQQFLVQEIPVETVQAPVRKPAASVELFG